MKKKVFGRRFSRDVNERKALFKSLMSSLVLRGRIKTTEEKAKAIKGQIDKLINQAKKEKFIARNLLMPYFSPVALEKIIVEIAPRFNKRTSGCTRILKTGTRFGDSASMVVMEWTEQGSQIIKTSIDKTSLKSQKLELKVKKDEKKAKKKIVKKTEVKK